MHREGDRRAGEVEGGERFRVQLAEGGDEVLRPEAEIGRTAGMEPPGYGPIRLHPVHRRAEGRKQRLDVAARVEEVHRPARAGPVARGRMPEADTGGEDALLPRLGPEKAVADLEQRQVREAPRAVARRRRHQAGQRAGPHVGHLGGDRVLQRQRRRAAVKGHCLVHRDEGIGDAFVHPLRRQHPPRARHALLHRGPGRRGHARAAPGQRGRFELRQRGDARDLLDQIGLAANIGPPGGDRHVEAAFRLDHAEAQFGQDARLFVGRDGHADQRLGAIRAQGVAARRIRHRPRDDDMRRLAPAQVEHHARGQLHPVAGEGRVDATLEAVAGIRVDAQLAPRRRRAHRVEIRRLDEHVGRPGRAARMQPAHDPADPLRPGIVADEGHGVVEGVFLFVQRDEALAGPRQANMDIARHLGGVEDVQRAGPVVGEVVGDIDQRRDGSQADGLEPPLQPVGRRPVGHAAHHATDEERARLVRHVVMQRDADGAVERPRHRLDGRGL